MAQKYTIWEKWIELNDVTVSGASVEVRLSSTGSLATIYSDETGTALTNPTTSDSDGKAFFYVAEGYYDITFTKGVDSAVLNNVPIGSSQSRDIGMVNRVITANGSATQDDSENLVIFDSATDITFTLTNGLEINTLLSFSSINAGLATFLVTGGDTITSSGSFVESGGLGTTQSALKIDATTWLLMGALQ
jgi:hypothetical protein